MKVISSDDIKNVDINSEECLEWIDRVLMNRDDFVMPAKTRMTFGDSDYCNIMPAMQNGGGYFGVKVINRSENRRKNGGFNLDSQILIYDKADCNLIALLDGNYITTMRTAAVAVHSIRSFSHDLNTLAMVGLGNIGTLIGQYLFDLTTDRKYTVKLLRYKDHADRFIARFKEYTNINFVICEDYVSLMTDSDVIVSSVTYIKDDFCNPSVYKKGCTIIPVHMRGFINCDLEFEHILVSDMDRAKHEFKNYSKFKRVTLTDDVLENKVELRETPEDRVIVYNLGLAITDLYFASEILKRIDAKDSAEIRPKDCFYV